jgi:hypothetical protein
MNELTTDETFITDNNYIASIDIFIYDGTMPLLDNDTDIVIHLDGNYNQDITGIEWPDRLVKLHLGGDFNQDISMIKLYSLIYIDLGFKFDQDISKVQWPNNLRTMELSYYFTHDVVVPDSLNALNLGHGLLHVVIFGARFDQDISNIIWPSHLDSIIIDNCRTLNLSNVHWPKTLRTLIFTLIFNSRCVMNANDIHFDEMPILSVLKFNNNFNRNISINFPQTLYSLDLGEYYNYPVDDIKWPQNLRILKFGFHFNCDISASSFPDSIIEITFGYYFNQNISLVHWPKRLSIIHFGYLFRQDIQGTIFHELSIVYDRSSTITINSCKFPSTLYQIIHYPHRKSTEEDRIVVYECKPGRFTKGACSI